MKKGIIIAFIVGLVISAGLVSAYCNINAASCYKYPVPTGQPSVFQRPFVPFVGETVSPYRRSFTPYIGSTTSPYRRSFVPTIGETISPYRRSFTPYIGEAVSKYRKSFC